MVEKLGEFKELFLKILFPALVVATMVVSYRKAMKLKQSNFNIAASYIIAGGIAYLTGDFILNNVRDDLITLSVAIICFSSEKIVKYMLYTFNVEEWLKHLFDFLISKKTEK